jgi:ABC-type lipoprotein export system ATPase subunit/GNAT superfamily N-acetyltransferase
MKKIELVSNINNDDYTQYVYDAFDIQNKQETITTIQFDLDSIDKFDWNIGVILGNSGSGKSTILKSIGNIKTPSFDLSKPLISNFDWLEPKDATHLLTSIGLSSVPTWLRPYHMLSNGEQYRATLAYLVGSAKDNDILLVDEYTSVVDRDVAKAMSYALQKYIRRTNKRIILASCHYDILEWLMPDWTCSPQKGGTLEKCDYLRRGRPQIELQVSRVEYETWDIFKKHHYLTEDVNRSCKFFLFEWNDKPVAIVAVIPQPSGYYNNGVRGSRTVVLPDYQGMGIGSRIADFIGGIFSNAGYRYFTKTVNPALGEYRNKSDKWKNSAKHGRSTERGLNDGMHKKIKSRPSYCHEYIGESVIEYEELMLPIEEMRLNKKLKSVTNSVSKFFSL